jgi:Ran GTPase-activating protein (RanGAP) involved in mRNA processing and transport
MNELCLIVFTVVSEQYTYRNPVVEELIAECQPGSAVRLSEQQLTDRDMEIVVQQAIINKRCRNLWLEYNKITSEGASILGNALHSNTTLCELWLYKNHVSDMGVRYLAQALSTNETLKKLGLASNGITDAGVCYMVEMFKRNRTLTTLGLAINQIGDQGAQMLATALAHQNTNLEVLTLDRNDLVTDLSVNSVINMIKHNRSLKELWVNGCSLSEKGKKKLREAIESKKDFNLVTV